MSNSDPMPSIKVLLLRTMSEDSCEAGEATALLSDFIDRGGLIEIDDVTTAQIKSIIRNREGRIDSSFAQFMTSLSDKGESFIDEMTFHLNRWTSDRVSTQSVLWTLRRLGQRAIAAKETIIPCLRSTDAWARYYAIIALSGIDGNSESTLAAISNTLMNENEPFVVFACIRSILESNRRGMYRQLCNKFIAKFYDKMNYSEQEIIDELMKGDSSS